MISKIPRFGIYYKDLIMSLNQESMTLFHDWLIPFIDIYKRGARETHHSYFYSLTPQL
jgi:hypothetical protein